jgi:polyisoprenoid-binding protein YceI
MAISDGMIWLAQRMKLGGTGKRAFWQTRNLVCGFLVAACAWAQTPQPLPHANFAEITLRLDPAQSKLDWTLGSTLHTVHGMFALKRGEMRFDPASGIASGEFAADATSGKSGNESRDAKMHREILESARYTEVVFRPHRIEGKVAEQGTSNVEVSGTFLLHGSEHELIVPVQAEISGHRWKGTAKFSVPYVQWGLKSPNTFLLKADPAVEIVLELSGTLEGTGGR